MTNFKIQMPNQQQMSNQYQNLRLIIGILFVIWILTLGISETVFAAPQFLVSWQAKSYAPNWYQGKILPTKGSSLTVSFELVDGGKIADLSRAKVRWYVNDKLVKNETDGLGIKSLDISVPDYGGQETAIRISLPDYAASPLDYVVRIPVKSPEVVIDGRSTPLKAGDNSFEAIPFYFNASDLNNLAFDWSANGDRAANNTDTPWLLNLSIDPNTPPGFAVSLQVAVQSFLNQLEFASKTMRLGVK